MIKSKRYLITSVFISLVGCTQTLAPGDEAGTGQQLESSVTPDNPDAILQPKNRLQEDTIVAAEHDRAESGIPYAGVWAASAPGCGLIDQGAYDSFAVITPSGIRQFEEICTYVPRESASSLHELVATCRAEGETTTHVKRIEMVNGQRLKLSNIEGRAGFDLIRCNLPR